MVCKERPSCYIEAIKGTRIKNSDLLVSLDMVSLFTNVPVVEAVEMIKSKYDLPDLISHCLKTTCFKFNEERYKQIDGTLMGSPFSTLVANLFMGYFEDPTLETAVHKPKALLRYVDSLYGHTNTKNSMQQRKEP